jgi:hypothetical protein
MARKKEEETPTESPEKIREEHLNQLKKSLEELLMLNDDVELAAIVLKANGEEEPYVWRKGHFYDVASMLNQILHVYRAKASADLG